MTCARLPIKKKKKIRRRLCLAPVREPEENIHIHRHQLAVQFKVIEHAFGVMKLNFLFRMNSQQHFQSKSERNE